MSRSHPAGARVGAVAVVEGAQVALGEPSTVRLAVRLQQALADVVLPVASQVGDLALEPLEVDVARERVGGEEEVQPHLRLVLAHRQLVVDVRRGEGRGQVLLDAAPRVGVEAVARQDDHDRHASRERVGAQRQPHAALLLEAEDGADLAQQRRRVGPEQVGARQAVEDLDDRLVVVRAGRGAVELEHLPQRAAQDGDLLGRREVGLARQEPQEAPLAQHLPAVAELLDADVVHARRAVHGALGVGLGDHHHAPAEDALAQALGDLPHGHGLAVAAVVGLAQDAEAGAGREPQRLLALDVDQVVLAVAEEDEVLVEQPGQERRVLLDLLGALAVAPLGAAARSSCR
jgi:hypothetical protein